jgi:hypothetical protein
VTIPVTVARVRCILAFLGAENGLRARRSDERDYPEEYSYSITSLMVERKYREACNTETWIIGDTLRNGDNLGRSDGNIPGGKLQGSVRVTWSG